MRQPLEVGVCGSSLFVAGIEAALRKQEGIRASRLGSSLTEAVLEIDMLSPHAILFETDESNAEQSALTGILRKHPEAKLIGLNSEYDAATIFSAAEYLLPSLEELAQIIK